MAAELEGVISGDSRGFVDASKKAQRSLGDLQSKGTKAGAKLGAAFKSVAGGLVKVAKLGAVAGAALSAVGVAAVVSFAKFEKKFAQVTTLIDGQPKKIRQLSKDLRQLSVVMGIDVLEATEAAYQAISAGRTVAQAPAFLEAAFKAAAAGASTADEAVDALTTVMNAFKSQAIDVNTASDVLFATIKAGKTTMSELAASLGQVAPVAASAGVQFKDIAAAMAAVTASGLNTAETATALKATIVGILKPSQSAAKALKSIGVSSDTLADSSLGLEDAIRKVRQAVTQNNRKLVEFFPNVRALNGVAILAGDGFGKFIETLKATRNATGAAETAFRKVSRTLAFQFSSVVQGAKDAFRSLGEGLAPIFAPFVGSMNTAITKARDIMGGFAEFMQKRGDRIGRVVKILVGTVRAGFSAMFAVIGINLGSAGKSFDSFLDAVERNATNIKREATELGVSIGLFVKKTLIVVDKVIVIFGMLWEAAVEMKNKTVGAVGLISGSLRAMASPVAGIVVGFELLVNVVKLSVQGLRELAAAIEAAVKAGLAAIPNATAAARKSAREAELALRDLVKEGERLKRSLTLEGIAERFAEVKGSIDGMAAAIKGETDALLAAAAAAKKEADAIRFATSARKDRIKLESDARKKTPGGGRRGGRRRRSGGGRRGFLQLGIVRGQRGAGFPGLTGAAGQFGTVGATAGQGVAPGLGLGGGGRGRGGGGGGQQGAMAALAELFARFRKLAKATADDPKISAAFAAVKDKVKALAATIGTDAFGPAFVRLKQEITDQLAKGLVTPEAFTKLAADIQGTFEKTAEALDGSGLEKKFGKIQERFAELGDATGPEAQAKFQALADKMKKLADTANGEAKVKLEALAVAMKDAADKAGKAGLAGELNEAAAAMDALKAKATSFATAAGSGGGGGSFRSGRRSITGRPISDGGQVARRHAGGFLNRSGTFMGQRGEFVIRRRAAQAIGAGALRRANRVTVNNTINASETSALGNREAIRKMLPELRRQSKLGVRQGGPF